MIFRFQNLKFGGDGGRGDGIGDGDDVPLCCIIKENFTPP